ncbi:MULTISPECIES: hypothetical protein [Atopobiaceae]|uniref:Uncharacterized protein n=1 Tax=Parafannyhessea umbonata TaxID=604330 RepID=A0A1H9P8M4_9ACTN|nr:MULTISPECIES: hypothetical protein [Atopobiaceae]SEH43466.1 hypothetical protein SAMN05216447_102153 [Parafannyhessea umbonata]SER44245.1 hypothetical protein SAMN05216446_0873 [Parafannyhessea umbonata]SJZ58169.1 hypothetical protein SAMN06298223_0813 [Olsenella sp. KH1P3]
MRWRYESLVEETIRDFVAKQIPDARDWEDCEYNLVNVPYDPEDVVTAVQVDVNIPTSSADAWLTFLVVEYSEEEDPGVECLRCVRNGRGEHSDTIYAWDDVICEWETVSDAESAGNTLTASNARSASDARTA